MEQPKILTPEEQARIEEERMENQERFEGEADKQNKRRSVGEKLLGQNKVSAVDIAHEEALRENLSFDIQKEHDDRDAARKASEDESFSQEMAAAERGEFNLDRSRFKGEHLESIVRGKNSEGAERARQLAEVNNGALDSLYEREAALVQNGQWSPESSALYVPGFNPAEVNELKRQKNERFERLKAMHQERVKAQEENQKQEALRVLTESFPTEKAQIDSGTWRAETSHIKRASFDVTVDRQVSATARRMFDELVAYESKIISDQERPKAASAYEKEAALAKAGTWKREVSYFTSIQKDSRWNRFDSSFRRYVQEQLTVLGMNNWQGATGGPRGFGGNEGGFSLEKETLEDRARTILGLGSKVTYEDAKAAYRRFMMQNHPDRNPDGVSKKIAEQIGELTQVWPVLEESLKKKESRV